MYSSKLPQMLLAVVATSCLFCAPSRAQTASSADSFTRLDQTTGILSTCRNRGAGWVCDSKPDGRIALQTQIEQLRSENARLKADIARRERAAASQGEKVAEALPKGDLEKRSKTPAPERAAKSEEPEQATRAAVKPDRHDSRKDGQAMSLFARAWQRLVDLASRVQKDVSGNI